MDEPNRINRDAWNERATIHVGGSPSYPVEAFKAGKAGLKPNTPDDLGDVRGRRLLHLQCHFGLDSLMWVRQGAAVTGVDFSPMAIAEARSLAAATGLSASFLEADVANLPDSLAQQFDIALSYFGTILWIGDLKHWARGIARSLKQGGFFYLADDHPAALAMEIAPGESVPRPHFKYFGDGTPTACQRSGTYAAPLAKVEHDVTYQWQHTLQDIVSAIVAADLRLDFLHEFPYAFREAYSQPDRKLMHQDEHGWWHLLDGAELLPLMFSLKASKP
jgi:SAM-dependent methyltransferase